MWVERLAHEWRRRLPDGEWVVRATIAPHLSECTHFIPFAKCTAGAQCMHGNDCMLRLNGAQRDKLLNLANLRSFRAFDDAFEPLVIDDDDKDGQLERACLSPVKFEESDQEGVVHLALELDDDGTPPCMRSRDKSDLCCEPISVHTGKGGMIPDKHTLEMRTRQVDSLLALYAACEVKRHAQSQEGPAWLNKVETLGFPHQFLLEVDEYGDVRGPVPSVSGDTVTNALKTSSPFQKGLHALECMAAADGMLLQVYVIISNRALEKRKRDSTKKPMLHLEKMAKVLGEHQDDPLASYR
mmetsp:Transcript_12135/g.36166  ORF Transcript_12135/g.36166 Transcript_12135/m.36166 type:complete len:298 (+) Transcript_12135:299-1192(+)